MRRSARKPLADDPLPVKEGVVQIVASAPTARPSRPVTALARRRRGGLGCGRRKRLAELPPREGGLCHERAFSPDGKTIVAGYRSMRRGGGGVVLWDVTARKSPPARQPAREGGPRHQRGLQPRRQDHRGRIRVAASSSGGVVLWDVAARSVWRTTPPREGGRCPSVAFSPDGKTIAAGYGGRGRRRCAVGRGRAKRWGQSSPREGGLCPGVAFSPDGKTIAAGYGVGGGVVLWDVAAQRLRTSPSP